MIRPGLLRREFAIPLQSIQTELNRLFEEYWQAPGAARSSGASAPSPGPLPPDPPSWTPAVDLWETPAELTLVVDLPGVDPSTIDLSLAGGVLTLKGKKGNLAPTGDAAGPRRGRVKERAAGSFHRQVTLSDEVDFDKVEAQARDGVLIVKLPKRETPKPRTIAIQSASAPPADVS